jgi:glycerol kinase
MKYILALDQGTTSSRALIFDENKKVLGFSQVETKQFYPENSWVEQDALEIWNNQYKVALTAISDAGVRVEDMAAIGITNQRESTIVWEKETGTPIYNAIIWQDNRTSEFCKSLADKGYTNLIHTKTGLILDSYFSATKLKWILDNVPDARTKAMSGELLFGTVDSFLVWKLTHGALHITDATNASRTMLFNICEGIWDTELLALFEIPAEMLPEVVDSSGVYGYTDSSLFNEVRIPIASMIGDQQSALFGQGCIKKGDAKNTYGTGSFLLMQTGDNPAFSKNGLLTTIALQLNGKRTYALEGSAMIAGAVMKWLRDKLQLIDEVETSEKIAIEAGDNGGVYFVPAFVGLGSPYWNKNAKALITGLTLYSEKKHVVRAALESLAYQTYELIKLMKEDSGISLSSLSVDGGASQNNFLMQFQADILQTSIIRPENIEATALGAALLAGLAIELWNEKNIFSDFNSRKFIPEMNVNQRESLVNNWDRAVRQCIS